MADNRLSQSKFAEKLGISRQAVYKAIKTGALILHGKGRAAYIDLDDPLTVAYMKSPSVNRPRPRTPNPPGKPKAPAPKGSKEKSVPDSPDKQLDLPASNDDQVSDYLANREIDRRKKEQEIEKLTLANKARRNELIEREAVQQFIDQIYAIHNGQLRTLGLRASSDLAAIFRIEDDNLIRKACDKIDADVLSILKHIKRDMNKFLKKIGGQKIDKNKAA